jgi:hypothetical protein
MIVFFLPVKACGDDKATLVVSITGSFFLLLEVLGVFDMQLQTERGRTGLNRILRLGFTETFGGIFLTASMDSSSIL